jgi:peptide/nickel transport system permease protein
VWLGFRRGSQDGLAVTGFALFLARRLLGIAFLVWVVTVAAFLLIRAGPPNPVAAAQVAQQLGPGRSASWQYFHYLLRLLHGNFGASLTVGLPVSTILSRSLPPTLSLMVGGMVVWLAGGIVGGAVSALRRGSLADRVITGTAVGVQAVPTFLVVLLLLGLFSYLARAVGTVWIQPGYVPFSQSPGQWLGRMILPWIAVAATQAGATARLTRASVLEVLGEDYIRTAHAKGVAARRVLWLHALRPAVMPAISSISVGFGLLLSYAAIVDQVFALGGIGQALLNALKIGDVMVIMGAVILTVILTALVSLATDIVLAILDPRVRLT